MGTTSSKPDDENAFASKKSNNLNLNTHHSEFDHDESIMGQDSKSTMDSTANSKMMMSFQDMDTPRMNFNSVASENDCTGVSSHITDDQVHVNLAMADLMAYLQVVANNSNNLPLTRRDDPEIGKPVSSTSPDEYARKSAAFVPSDVRVICGSFSRYGRVWDLPTSEEFDATDGAQEPGRSYGGACCNAMLKVLYDAASDVADAAQTAAASEALFDDDEDEDESILSKSMPSVNSLEYAPSNPSTISWAALLRRMKDEIGEIEYAQYPTLTTTRKFDLNQPFSIVPKDFDPKKGKKRSLLIGCNYNNIHGAELKASHDDVGSMKDYIVNVHGFPEKKGLMTILLDDDQHKHPTHMNITEAFKALSEQAQAGDAVFIQFSGHGGRILDSPIDSEAESYDEVIVPSDYAVSGLIRDTLIFKTLLAPMRYGVTVTILIDCCDTGMAMDLPYKYNTKIDQPENLAKLSVNEDFSFVRFLKVVRTLYETSTFTQLGKTVGSVLNHPSAGNSVNRDCFSEDEVETQGSIVTTEEDDAMTSAFTRDPEKQTSILNALASCASAKNTKGPLKKKSNDDRKKGDRGENESIGETHSPSLLDQVMMSTRAPFIEQVINCTLAHGDESSEDEETYTRRDDSLGSSTYDTLSEDGSMSRRHRRSRKSKRR